MGYGDFFRELPGRFASSLSSLSLARKLFLSYLLVLVVPVMIGTTVLLRTTRTGLEAELLAANQRAVETVAALVAKNSAILKNASQTVIGNARLSSTLAEDGPFTTEELLDLRWSVLDTIDNIKYINVDIRSLRIYHPNRAIPELYPTLYDEQIVSFEDWYPDVIQGAGSPHWRFSVTSDARYEDPSDAVPVVALYRQLRLHGRHLGVIEITMLSESFFGVSFSTPGTSESLMCAVHDDSFYYDSRHTSPSFFGADVSRLLTFFKDEIAEGRQARIARVGSVELAFSAVYVREIDTWICRFDGLTALNGRLNRAVALILVIAVAMILVLSVVTHTITNALTARLALVVDAITRLHTGSVCPELAVYGNDEIGVLARHFRMMMARMNELIFTLVRKETAAKEAEISALHAQIDGHFIHNVLETVKMMAVVEGKFAISDALTSLGRLMRYTMSRERRYVWIQEEIAYVSVYMKLLNIRFNGKMRLSIDCPAELEEQEVPKMILQPVVENAVRHGIEPAGGGLISITVRRLDADVLIEVMDTGEGMRLERLEEVRERLKQRSVGNQSGSMGIGLVNVHERIRLHCGAEYGLEIDSTPGTGTTVRIRIPLFGRHGGAS